MKKVVAVLVALILAITCAVSVSAADNIIGGGSGQLTPIFADFDPSAVTEMLAGMDFSGILNDLGMGDLGGLLGNVDIGGLLGNTDIGGLLGNLDLGGILGDLNLEDLLGKIMPGGNKEDPSTTAAPTTTGNDPSNSSNPSSATTTKPSSPSTTAPKKDVPKTGDAGIAAAVALTVIAGAAFVCTRKKVAVAE